MEAGPAQNLRQRVRFNVSLAESVALGSCCSVTAVTVPCWPLQYTQSNARFAVTVDPSNAALLERKQRIDEARAKVRLK